MKPFTFKKKPLETGLAAVANPHPWVDIKLNKKVVGSIVPPNAFSRDDVFKIMLRVVDATSNCGWRWITLKFKGQSEAEVRQFLKEHGAAIQEKYSLYTPLDDEST